MDIPILFNSDCGHVHRIEETIRTINHIQKYFRLLPVAADWLPDDETEQEEVDTDEIGRLVESKFRAPQAVAVVHNPLANGHFSYSYRDLTIISMADWEVTFAPPPLKVYLAYKCAEALLYFAVDLPPEKIEVWTHVPPIGCFFDTLSYEKSSIKLGMVGANLCGDCEYKVFGMGLSTPALEAIEQILGYVRSFTIRRPRTDPSYVFIGHGHSDAWKKLRDYLTQELSLQVEEFNQEPVAGLSTTERLQEMLSRSCFAFLVMTAEDVRDGKKMHARENVIHEIGLFQGRLGFRRAIVLKEKKCEEFSNIHGLTYVEFDENSFDAATEQIRGALEREQIITPSLTPAPARRATRRSRPPRKKAKARRPA